MHNESLAEQVLEPIKLSRLDRIKSNAVEAAWIIIPVVVTGASMYYSGRLVKMQLDTAKLSLEAAKLAAEQAK